MLWWGTEYTSMKKESQAYAMLFLKKTQRTQTICPFLLSNSSVGEPKKKFGAQRRQPQKCLVKSTWGWTGVGEQRFTPSGWCNRICSGLTVRKITTRPGSSCGKGRVTLLRLSPRNWQKPPGVSSSLKRNRTRKPETETETDCSRFLVKLGKHH